MTTESYPIAARYPPELSLMLGQMPLSPQTLQALLQLQGIEHEVLAAMHAISQVDLYAAAIAYDTVQMAELLKLMHGWSPELEHYDHARRAQYLATMHELVAWAHAQIVARMKGT